MIKRVAIADLRIGMFIHDLDCGWLDHPFVSNQLYVKDERTIRKLMSSGLDHVYIDTERGQDVETAVEASVVDAALQLELETIAEANQATISPETSEHERLRAKTLLYDATLQIRRVMEAVRTGRPLELHGLEPLIDRMIQSAFSNPHAITSIARLKLRDEYTFMHSVSVAALLVTFARELELTYSEIQGLALGGLLHDIGKALVPLTVLNKPAALTDLEFAQMKQHVDLGSGLLCQLPGLDPVAIKVMQLHHERVDGSGYPLGLKHDQIDRIGRMAAIVDVYDALTSVRVYKEAWLPNKATKKLLEWSDSHFDRALVLHFARCIGVYPVGSVVALESGLLAIVVDQGNDLLRPLVRVVYNRKHRHFERVKDIALENSPADRIVGAVDPAIYGIDVERFL